MFTKLTDEGRKTLKNNPERLYEVNKEIEGMGAKVLNQFAIMGEYDFVNILEAPDNKTIAKISVEMGARGTVQPISSPALTIEEFVSMLK
jgi:uncharacterized protein with GYD domain